MQNQVANSFDKSTIIKIITGGAISATAGIALALLNYLGTLQFSDPLLTLAVSVLVPFAVNIVKEYTAGVPAQ